MPQSVKPPGFFAKVMITGAILSAAGGGLFLYTINIPSSGVAMSGIATGLLSLLGLVMSGVGAIIALVFMILWLRAKSRPEGS